MICLGKFLLKMIVWVAKILPWVIKKKSIIYSLFQICLKFYQKSMQWNDHELRGKNVN